ncbi:MAG: pyruvate/2-oxoglutarate/acetoin dehydrogenase E1 component [Paracoccaceae bacterium]|jgi:pyruvate/2-oxoglutarate/acetoin dehydrogenase E1 component
MKYFDELKRSMEWLATMPNTIFIGQAVACPGTAMSNTFKNINPSQLIELPVAEEMQMGMSLGLALDGKVPISIFPRWNFLLCGMNQLINHIDKVTIMSNGGFKPKIIIRTGIGAIDPLNPQCQHVGDFTDAIQAMCSSIDVIKLEEPEDIFVSYEKAFLREDDRTTICVEYGDYYNQK